MTPEQLTAITDSINAGSWAIIGTLWALIFSTTWKG